MRVSKKRSLWIIDGSKYDTVASVVNVLAKTASVLFHKIGSGGIIRKHLIVRQKQLFSASKQGSSLLPTSYWKG